MRFDLVYDYFSKNEMVKYEKLDYFGKMLTIQNCG